MRLREPFQGFKLVSGHFIIHVAMLQANLSIVDHKQLQLTPYDNPDTGVSLLSLVHLVRYVRVACMTF